MAKDKYAGLDQFKGYPKGQVSEVAAVNPPKKKGKVQVPLKASKTAPMKSAVKPLGKLTKKGK